MKTIVDYLDAAMARNNLTSGRQLALALGVYPSVENSIRAGKMWPSNALMLKIAELAGVQPERALLDLLAWREPDAKSRAVLTKVAKMFTVAAMMMGPPGASPTPAVAAHAAPPRQPDAANIAERTSGEHSRLTFDALYIMRLRLSRFLRRLFARPALVLTPA